MAEENNITLVVACDNHYLIMLSALLKSIELNHTRPEHIDVWIIDDDVTKANKAKLEKSLAADFMTINWINGKSVIPQGMSLPLDKNTYPLNIFMRLFIPYFLPATVKKALYLDVDMLVLTDISELWNTDIGDNIAGAVTDSICKTVNVGIKNYKDLGLDGSENYFNSGLLLMDLEKWVKNNVSQKVITCVNENRDFATFSDQYGLNVVLHKQWAHIDPLWNYYSNGDYPKPHLIHFFHRKPFYSTYNYNKDYQKLFYEYLNQTEWKNAKPVNEFSRYLVKVGNILEKIPLLFRKQA
ncbi:glycosyl transferase family 8 [Pseudopedobacter saltans DSM 12145]|uniref:Glycosyl transferase family 8 n=1 Tax=Pseudopedobacter saltans (strain ATCC 51119 / DSM 12145 / JCM 21818 / CCUG 39354 / LMG 10337 / NBRC 100064 / NCIMB 13643) TaxID=762903 RepID=F0SBF6_PSESL|nr:glycosyltransferase family 8 protein [Pseudopedobacter saltans]ADY51602.1 glycosyl transferase family 8 [Pseudopedobacter saltans DSM 12145]